MMSIGYREIITQEFYAKKIKLVLLMGCDGLCYFSLEQFFTSLISDIIPNYNGLLKATEMEKCWHAEACDKYKPVWNN